MWYFVIPPLTAREGGFTDYIAEEMQRKFIKERKLLDCFALAMSRRFPVSTYKYRCIQPCDTLHLQNSACLCKHFRLTVNIPNRRFLILILIHSHNCNCLSSQRSSDMVTTFQIINTVSAPYCFVPSTLPFSNGDQRPMCCNYVYFCLTNWLKTPLEMLTSVRISHNRTIQIFD